MAAWSPFLVRRASSCSSVILVAVRSLVSSSSSVFHLHNRQHFSTSSANSPGETSGRFASVTELRNSKQIAYGISDRSSLLDGLPFDSIEGPKDGTLTLRRKTEDEIIEIRVKEEKDYDSGLTVHAMNIKIHYGFSFEKHMEFEVVVFPGDECKIVIRSVTMSVDVSEGDSEVHVDELESFFEKRGINRINLDFLVKYVEKRKEHDNLVKLYGKPASLGSSLDAYD